MLIALSFEGVASWREHRALVREARANLTSEMRDNMKKLKERLEKVPTEAQNLDHAVDVVQALVDRKKFEDKSESVQLSFSSADLQNASHTTAEVTGAFGLMDYDEVKKYATVYWQQDLYMRFQNDGMQNMTRALATVGVFTRPETASPRELEDCKAQIRVALASLTAVEQLGRALLKEYERVLDQRDHR